jgi:hypothetical protein
VDGIISLLTSALNIHLNIGQNSIINTSSVFMSLQTLSVESLSNIVVQQIGINTQIHMPSTFSLNISNTSTISLRVRFLEFSFFDNFCNYSL